MKNGLIAVLIVFVIGLISYQSVTLSQLKNQAIEDRKTIAELQYQVDSLNYEKFPLEVEVGRHEMAFYIFTRRNPKAAEQYATIFSEETE